MRALIALAPLALALMLGLPFAGAHSSYAAQRPPVDGAVNNGRWPPPPQGTILWADEGTQASWEQAGGGGTFISAETGGSADVALVADPLGKLRQRVVREHISGPAGARQFRWADAKGVRFPDRMRFTAYLYLPNTVAVADYWNIWQTKTRFPDGSSNPVFIINGNGAVDPAGTWQGFELYQWRLQQRFGSFQIPVGRWVRVDVDYVWSTTNGSVMVRVNGGLVGAASHVQTEYPNACSRCTPRQWSLNNYSQEQGIGDYTLYWGKARARCLDRRPRETLSPLPCSPTARRTASAQPRRPQEGHR